MPSSKGKNGLEESPPFTSRLSSPRREIKIGVPHIGGKPSRHANFGADFDGRHALARDDLSLVPQVVDAVTMPVIASGGIMDGRGMTAAECSGNWSTANQFYCRRTV